MSVDRAADSGSELAEQLERRRAAAAAGWNLGDEVVVIGAGDPVPVPGRYDRTYPFRSHSEYFYLTDRERPGGVLAFDPEEGWVDFVAPVTREELLWSGAGELEGAVPEGTRSRDDLAAWLRSQDGWVPLGAADEQKPAAEGTVEAWGRDASNPVGGWHGLRKGYRGRFGMYLPPLLEELGLAELTHENRNNSVRAL